MNACRKSSAPCQLRHSPDILQMTHSVIVALFCADNNTIYGIFACFDGISKTIQIQLIITVFAVSGELCRYILFPVWTLTYPGKDGKVYYYAMNGQTGTINGDFPFERKKALLTSVVSALFVLIFMLVGGYFS